MKIELNTTYGLIYFMNASIVINHEKRYIEIWEKSDKRNIKSRFYFGEIHSAYKNGEKIPL